MSAQDQVQAVEEKIASQGAPVAEEAPVTPPPAQPSGEEESNDELVDTASTEGAEARKTNKKSASDRISELYRKTKDSERQAEAERAEKEYWRQLALKNQTAPTPPAENAQKTLEDFNYDQRAYDKYLIREEVKAELAEHDRGERIKAQQAQAAERDKSWMDRIQKFEEANPDIDYVKDVMHGPLYINDHMADFIKESDVGPEMGVYFKDHPGEDKTIFDMNPAQAARALAKLEIKLSASKPEIPAQPAQITRAPPAPPRLNASSAGRSASDGVVAEIAALRAKNHR